MTDELLPRGLAGLPTPWNLTSARVRRAALAGGSQDAPAVLDRVLDELPALVAHVPGDHELPAELGEYFDFTADKLSMAIPVLDSISIQALTDAVRDWTGEVPNPSETVALGRRWLALMVWYLTSEAVSATPAGRADDLAAVLARHLSRIDSGTAARLLAQLGYVHDGPLLSLLQSVAADDGLDAEVRDQARRMLAAARQP